MGKRQQFLETGRCQPADHSRGQLMNRQHIHVVRLQNAKDRRRVGRTPRALMEDYLKVPNLIIAREAAYSLPNTHSSLRRLTSNGFSAR
jgi:hypothetical protein